MKDHLATREEAIAIGKQMHNQLLALSQKYQKSDTGRIEWTKAIWDYFDCLRTNYDWGFAPENQPTYGKAKGEFLTDFALFDERFGNRVICESEWGNIGRIQGAFDKLREVKGDLKIIVFQFKFEGERRLPDKLERLFKQSLASSGHHHPGHEFYLFIQFEGDESRLFLWEPISSGPFSEGEIKIEQVN
jgi:hypothetical protein